MNIRRFLDLNEQDSEGFTLDQDAGQALNRPAVLAYGPESEPPEKAKSTSRNIRKRIGFLEQVSMYLGLLIGVLAAPFSIDGFKNTLSAARVGWGYILFSLVIAFILTPMAYKKVRVDPHAPWIVRFGLFVQNGFFWEALLEGIKKTISA